MTQDRQSFRTSNPSDRSTPARHWYQRRAAIGTVAALAVLAAGVTAVGLSGAESTVRTQRLADGTGPGIQHNGWGGATPRASHPTVKATPGKPAPGKTGSTPSAATTTGSASSPTGGAGGASVPGSSLSLGGGTAFGASLDLAGGGGFQQALAAQDRRFGGLDVVRVFYPGFPAPWSSRPELAGRNSVVSFKIPPASVLSGSYDSRLLQWFKTAPRTGNVFWTYWHEPENDAQLNKAQYRAAWQHISALSRQANNPRLHSTLILMGYTVRPGSGRDWHDWYPGSAAIDVMGWDVYNVGAKKGIYSDPANLYGPVAAVSRSVGKPWGIGETGSRLIPGDNGSQRAAWLRSAAQYLDSHGALWAAYWDVDAKGGSFKLSDAPSIAAWRAAVSS